MICDVLAISSVPKGDVGCENTGFAGKKRKMYGNLQNETENFETTVNGCKYWCPNRWANVG